MTQEDHHEDDDQDEEEEAASDVHTVSKKSEHERTIPQEGVHVNVWVVTEPGWDRTAIHAVCDSEELAWEVAGRMIDLNREGLGKRAADILKFELLTKEESK